MVDVVGELPQFDEPCLERADPLFGERELVAALLPPVIMGGGFLLLLAVGCNKASDQDVDDLISGWNERSTRLFDDVMKPEEPAAEEEV